MNIFILSHDHNEAARFYCDKHIVKIPLEIAQVLCTTHHELNTQFNPPYRPTHKNHPICKWARTSKENYLWTINHGLAICKEYTYRYGKIHKCEAVICWAFNNTPESFSFSSLTPFYLAMPDDCKVECPVQSYRNYYNRHKRHLHSWKERPVPKWIENV